MNHMHEVFDSFVMKIMTLTEAFLENDSIKMDEVDDFTETRDRLFNILDHISLKINWDAVEDTFKEESFRKIDYIKSLDNKVILKLKEIQLSIKNEIEQTVKNKDMIKGYNLSEVK